MTHYKNGNNEDVKDERGGYEDDSDDNDSDGNDSDDDDDEIIASKTVTDIPAVKSRRSNLSSQFAF